MTSVHYEAPPCSRCGATKRYVRDKKCVQCINLRRHKYDTPENKRSSARRRLYGLSVEETHRKVIEQNGVCAICSVPLNEMDGRRFFHVDHDHTSKQVRGILCSSCNNGLRCYKDNPTLLRSAVAYLETYGKQ